MFEICNLKFKNILDIEALTIDRPITCIIGSSGSGKTTLLKHLNKLYTPDSGAITYNGSDLAEIPAVSLRREVVMLGQTPVIYNGDLEENLQIGLRFSEKLPASRDRLLNALEQVKLNKPLDDPCLSLSGGENSASVWHASCSWTRRFICLTSPRQRWIRKRSVLSSPIWPIL